LNPNMIRLYDYHCWANGKVLDHLRTLPEEVFRKEVELGFRSVADVIGHIAAADEVWLTRLQGSSPAGLVSKAFASVEEAGDWMARTESQFREWIVSADDDRFVTYRNTKGTEFRNTAAEIVQHLVNHGTYHRGNVTTILRFLGHPGVQTDYIAFVRR